MNQTWSDAVFIFTAVLSVLLAAGLAVGGAKKLSTDADVMTAELGRLGVSLRLARLIGLLEILGAAGLVIGLWAGPLGIAAATGLVVLMSGAVIYHVRARDTAKKTMPAVTMIVFSAAVLILRALTL
jgi:uncharacterized membrane protein YphA (DoxX/SURF4 family)